MGPLALIGDDAMTWGSTSYPNSHCPDLVTIRPRNVEDTFSKWITEKIVPVFFRFGFGRLNRVPTVHGDIGYNDSSLLRITFWITTVIASLLPIASISILYCVHSILARLAIIAAFNVVVSICLTAFTAAKRMDVFAVAAAYVSLSQRRYQATNSDFCSFSAVQVVFVGTNITPTYQNSGSN